MKSVLCFFSQRLKVKKEPKLKVYTINCGDYIQTIIKALMSNLDNDSTSNNRYIICSNLRHRLSRSPNNI